MKAQVGAMVKEVEPPSLGTTIDEVQVGAEASNKATRLPVNSHQEKVEHLKTDLIMMKKKTQTL